MEATIVRALIFTFLVVVIWPSPWVRAQTDSIWNVRANWLLLKRESPRSSPIITSGAGATIFDASQFDFDYESGFELIGSRQVTSNCTAELRYFQVDGFDAGASVSVPANSRFLGGTTQGTAALSYFTRLYSAEANLMTTSHVPWLDLIGGLRYVRFDDDSFASTSGTNSSIRVDNDLFGFQLGANATLLTAYDGLINLNAIGKVGLFCLDSQSSQHHEVIDSAARNLLAEADAAAMVAEIAIIGSYPITPRLSVEASYHLLWLEGVAVAGDQYPTTNLFPAPGTTALNHGGAFFHGFDLGLVLEW